MFCLAGWLCRSFMRSFVVRLTKENYSILGAISNLNCIFVHHNLSFRKMGIVIEFVWFISLSQKLRLYLLKSQNLHDFIQKRSGINIWKYQPIWDKVWIELIIFNLQGCCSTASWIFTSSSLFYHFDERHKCTRKHCQTAEYLLFSKMYSESINI